MSETGSSEAAAVLPTARLSIDGMHCLSCVLRIESALEDLPGVVTAAVDLAEGTAAVVYRPNAVTFDDLTQAVSTTGYRVTASAMVSGGQPRKAR